MGFSLTRVALCCALTLGTAAAQVATFSAADLDAALSPEKLAPQLASKRVVFVGEVHDRYDHHLNQLEIIRSLHKLDPSFAIGVEYLEQRFQPAVDDYIEGRISEKDFLRRTEYYEEWRYDYRLYAPIFRFAREQRIPVRALNVPASLVSAVSKTGRAGLSAADRDLLPPDSEPAGPDYTARLRRAFEGHGSAKPEAFHHFVEAQLVWDESMAAGAAAWLNMHPDKKMIVLAGAGHLEFGSGIPRRLVRRTHASSAIVLNVGGDEDLGPGVADYLLLSQTQELPPAGTLGVKLADSNGACNITSVLPGGAAAKAGLKHGDVLLSIDGEPVKRTADARVALWDHKPGDRVAVKVRRGKSATRQFDIELAAESPAGTR